MTDTGTFPRSVSETARDAERLIIDVAARIQLSPSQVKQAEDNYNALAEYIDSPGSPLQDKIDKVHASGSFAIEAPIVGKIRDTQHDVDAVLELVGFKDADPEQILKMVERALLRPDREGKSRYEGMVERQSRCVTVTYSDGRTVDLMPVHYLTDEKNHYRKLFHFKEAHGSRPRERYTKSVAPRGFKDWYLEQEQALSGPPLFLQETFFKSLNRPGFAGGSFS